MATFSYARLARHPGIWRVDGIGPVRSNGRLGIHTTVYFSGLSESSLNYPYKKTSLNGTSLALPIHVASLCEFKVGTVWREGKRVLGPEPISTWYQVDVSRVRLVSLGEAITINEHQISTVLPDLYFCLGSNRAQLAQTLYAIVPVLADWMTHWLIVPASELLRFYVGVSSPLLSDTLQGRLDNYISWDKSQLQEGAVTLHVKKRLTRKEAVVLGRAVASEYAKTTLFSVHQHLASVQAGNVLLNSDRKRQLIIKANFPFADSTQLYVAGKRMPLTSSDGKEDWAVFAMEILTCSHPYNFSILRINSEELLNCTGQTIAGDGGTQWPHHIPMFDQGQDELELTDELADKRLTPLVIRNHSNQFNALSDIKIEYHILAIGQMSRRNSKNTSVSVEAWTLNDGSYSQDAQGNQGVSEQQHHVEQINRDLAVFLSMLQFLRVKVQTLGWRIITRNNKGGLSQNGELIAVFPEKIGKCRTWHRMLIESEGSTRPRQVVWAEINLGNDERYLYLLEMELKSGENGQCTILLYLNDFSRLDDETFTELLILTAIQNRWTDQHNKWKNKHQRRAEMLFKKIIMYRLNHPPVPKIKQFDKEKTQLNPKLWSNILLEKITELLPYWK
ncbi:hypothetical protein B0F87_10411 [Methylobacter tundripaludum]|uniref:TnsE C-terminal domain-containing protein n=1 Tax=Methylobacter tundripaludum TaxID=173365 RepID=A0A2S6HEK2_9GAMM|nr:hypothetical protein [Methylobacter tundripaludum]PPK75924.1 hypothetical protein B0F87_10411 [Methylobacter tundripaludum]